MTLAEILALEEIIKKIQYLKKGRRTTLPDCVELWNDWNPEKHEIMTNKEKYPDRKVLKKEAEKIHDEVSGRTIDRGCRFFCP